MLYKNFKKLYLVVGFVGVAISCYAAENLSDDAIAKLLIQESIASYSGCCLCPYNTMKNGKACGGRSAYSKPDGESPLCYRNDVTADMIRQWRSLRNKK